MKVSVSGVVVIDISYLGTLLDLYSELSTVTPYIAEGSIDHITCLSVGHHPGVASYSILQRGSFT